MEWNGPPLQEWEIHSYLVLPACSIFFFRDTKIYANCNNAEIASGYCFALGLVCLCIYGFYTQVCLYVCVCVRTCTSEWVLACVHVSFELNKRTMTKRVV